MSTNEKSPSVLSDNLGLLDALIEKGSFLPREPEGDWEQNVSLRPSRSGPPSASIIGEEGNRVTLHSTVNPVVEGERLAEAVSIGPESLLVILGLGLGYHAESALKKASGRPAVIVEKEPDIWRAALTRIDLKTWIEGRDLYFIVGDEPNRPLLGLAPYSSSIN